MSPMLNRSNLSLLGESSSSISDLSRGRCPANLIKPHSESSRPGDALHYAVWHGKVSEIKRIVRDGGVSVETHNYHGQTPLFVAAYTQNYFTVKTLLQLGANPNGRCIAGYTPTHAACYSGSQKILSKILESGGDLRLHDENQCSPIDWALWQSDGEKKLRIMELIDSARRCTMKQSGKDALAEKQFSRNMGGRASLTTLFKRKLPVKGGKNGKQEVDMGELVKSIHAMGFGKMYFGNGMKAAAISTIPYIESSDLSPDRHHPTYSSGSFTEMSSKLWLHTRVTVRSLLEPPPSGAVVDTLISELEALCKLTHPQILLLMGVCQTKNYEGLMLVFEHVQLGSLYYCLHEKNCMPKIKSAVDIILQIVDALIYLHSHGWLHCSLTSHSIHLVGPSVAKLSSFELAVEDKEETRRNRTLDLLADKGWQSIYNWLCPDILKGEAPSKMGDMYSLCCLIWEISTGQVPWGNLDPDEILIEIKLKGHTLPLDKKYIPKHLLPVLEQGLKLRKDERDVNLHEIRDMLILTRKNAVKNEKKEQGEVHPSGHSSSYSHRNSSTTDSGVWFGSGSQPVRSYSSSAIQRSPQSSHSFQSYHPPPHHSAEEEEEEDHVSVKDIDEFTGLRKTSSILKRKKYDKTFGKLPSKTFSASHHNVDCNYDYVKNRAKRDFLRNGCVSKKDYIRANSNQSEEDLRRRSLSSLYHATLCASDKDNGIDLLSSSEHSNSSYDLSPYYSGDSLVGELNSHEKRRSGSPELLGETLRSRSVPRTNSSTIPLSNSAAEFVAAHLQEANKRGYGRTFSNLSQKSRENLDEEQCDDVNFPLPREGTLKKNRCPPSKRKEIKPASHATQRSSDSTSKTISTSSCKISTTHHPSAAATTNIKKATNKKDLVSSMSKLNLHLPVSASKSSSNKSFIYKNKSTSSIRRPMSVLKEINQARHKKLSDAKSKSLAALPKFTSIQCETLGGSSRVPAGTASSKQRKFPKQAGETESKEVKDEEGNGFDAARKVDQKHTVLIHSNVGPKHKSVSDLKVSNSTDSLHWKKSRNLANKKSLSVGSLKTSLETRATAPVAASSIVSRKEDTEKPQEPPVTGRSQQLNKAAARVVLRKNSGTAGGLASKYPRWPLERKENPSLPSFSGGKKTSPTLMNQHNKMGATAAAPYKLESKMFGSEGFSIQKIKPSVLMSLHKKGPNPNSVIYSHTRLIKQKEDLHCPFQTHYTSTSDRKSPGGDIVRSGDRVSSPPRSQWSTKGVQNLIQSLESIQQQKLQSVSLYQTAPSESYLNGSSNHRFAGPESGFKSNNLNQGENEVKSNEDNMDNFHCNNANEDNLIQLTSDDDHHQPVANQIPPSHDPTWNMDTNCNNGNNDENPYKNGPVNFCLGCEPSPINPPQYIDNHVSHDNNNNDGMTANDPTDQGIKREENPIPNNYYYDWQAEAPEEVNNPPLSSTQEPYQWNDNNNFPNGGYDVLDSNTALQHAQEPISQMWDCPASTDSTAIEPLSGQNDYMGTLTDTNNEANTLWNTASTQHQDDNTQKNHLWGGGAGEETMDVNLTQAKVDSSEVNNNINEDPSSNALNPTSQEVPPLSPLQSPILQNNVVEESSPPRQQETSCALVTSTPNEYKSHPIHHNLQSAYNTAMAEAVEEENESGGSSDCWNTADGDLINLQEDSVMKSTAMVRQMDKKLSRKSSQKQFARHIPGSYVESKREQNVTFNSEVLEISNSVSAYTQTPSAEMISSRRASASSSFMSQEDTEDLYCDDELNPSLENDPNMQLTISRLQDAAASVSQEDYPQNPIFNDQGSILSMDIPSTGPTSLRSELSEDKDNYNTASSDEDEDNSVSVRSVTPTNTITE